MKFTGERMVIGETDIELEVEHLNRYYFAEQLAEGKKVLDAACGTGYGSSILSSKAEKVFGIDISKEAIEYAVNTYEEENITFVEGTVESLPFEDSLFDLIVSFETIEHINEEQQKLFLEEIKRTMKQEGILVISTPNHSVYKNRGENHFHIKELEYIEFKEILQERFRYVNFYSQQNEVCNTILSDMESKCYINGSKDIANSEYIIAVCSDELLPHMNTRAFMREDQKLDSLTRWAIETDKLNTEKDRYIKKLDNDIEILRRNLLDSSNQVEILKKELANLEYRNKKIIDKFKSDIEKKQIEIDKFKSDIEKKQIEIGIKIDEIKDKNNIIDVLKMDLNEKQRSIEELNIELNNKKGHINQLLEIDREFTNIKNSRSWRVMCVLWRISARVLPHGSKRRLIAKTTFKFIKHPIAFVKKINMSRIRKFFYYLKKEGPIGVSRRLDDAIKGTKVEPVKIDVTEIIKKRLEDYERIIVPEFDEPKVSIVIPVYNQFEYTYNCISSIVKNSAEVSYEIIIANDCSSDLTTQIEEVIQGITVVNNETNLRFLKNCNNAANYSRGEYILFLNNDTQVQPNWLEPLVELIERDERIGMVGSKLVYPDGRLQEAGGIVWRDGSAWNYGHLSDPTDPEYNYVKEVDYISGAAIMIKKELWEEIGGFDERFVPAYYEDTDLSFEVRRHGYKVMYQPLSVVVHFEGVSNGTDLSSGQKAYQQLNAKKFYEKWKSVLEMEHKPNAVNVFKAKDRSFYKKHILVIDHYVPHYDQDAGSKCTWMYIELFVSMGMKVTFIGDNFYKHEPYTTKLNQMGVEVLYGNYYYNNWKKWIQENGKEFDYAYLNRPHISEKYIDILRKYSECKIIYFGHDLHYLRESRQYEIEKDPEVLKSAKQWKEREFALFNKTDVIYVVGSYEQKIIQKEFPNKPVRNIPVYIYNSLKDGVNVDFSTRNDIIFVGGFGHLPNKDAVLWFEKNIFPKILEKHPNIKWYIVGSKPTEEILNLASENIIVTGFVEDEELERLYSTCRMAVVPLRVGAGVKGKVVEAIYNRIPLITTPIGAEGLSLDENAFIVTDCDENMADTINDLYYDFDKLSELSLNCKDFITNHFTIKTALNVVLNDIDPTNKNTLI